MSYPAELRERAFELWYQNSQNDSEAVRALAAADYVVTRKTLAEWREKYQWADRAARLDALKQGAADTNLTFEEELLRDLLNQKKRYDAYFDTLEAGKADTQAMYVYMQLCKEIKSLTKELKPKDKKPIKKGLEKRAAADIKREILGMSDERD
jgi:Zn-dependent M32 family carboxypeptidase